MLSSRHQGSCRIRASLLYIATFTLYVATVTGDIKLRSGTVKPLLLQASSATSHRRSTLQKAHPAVHEQWGHLADGLQYLVHLNLSDRATTVDTVSEHLTTAGAAVTSYIPDDTLLVVAQPAQVQAIKQVEGVVWVGNFHEGYKASPEAQRLVGWASGRASHSMQQADNRHSAYPTSSQHAKAMHTYIRQAADGSSIVVFDVSFPHGLSTSVEEVSSAPQASGSNASAAIGSSDMIPQRKFHPANAAVADWQAPLDAVCHSQCRIAASGPGRVAVTAPVEIAQAVVEWLTAQPQVHWISPRPKTRAANFFATGIGQSGNAAPLADASNGAGAANDAGTHPLWDAGLNGQNQIVGMGDTGIDWLHCTFRDSSVPGPGAGPYSQEATTGFLYWVNTAHRKIVYYRQVADNVDGNGHGTHCAGSAVGSLQSSYTGWQGMAPQAKIAFQDLGSGASGSITTPDDLANGYYQYTYNQGARIHSDSWGTGSAVYDALAYDVDLFAFVNQDFLPIFAAGNFGYEEVDSTIASPSVSKNCLSVGASLTAPYSGTIEQEAVATDSKTYQIAVAGSLTATSTADSTHTVMLAYFGNNLDSAVSSGTAYPLVAGVPADGCSPLSYPYKLPGKVVLLARGNCTFQSKVANAQKGGAFAALIYNNQEDGFEKMQADSGWSGVTITMPSAFMPASTARPLLQDILAGASLTVTFQALTLPANRWESLAFFSSVGPALDGRFKPDIIAPGTTISPYSDDNVNSNNCALGTDRGTSMSTPVVAGAVALLRQYFMQGFYPTGAAVAGSAYTPSGPLLKAVLLGGAVGMTGLTPDQDPSKDGVPLDPPPSTRQGYGRMQLSNSLPLSSGSSHLQVVDKVPMTATGQSYKFCVTSSGGPLKVTLAWHDPPASLAATTQLVNDLDLTVYANSLNGYGLLGNGVPDRLNNVEQVSWNNLASGLVIIKVAAYRITPPPYSPQLFSLAVQGSFTGELQSRFNPGWSGSTSTSCSLPVAHISAAPPVLSNNLNPSFSFATTSDPATAGFQCKLSGTGGSTTAISNSQAVVPLQDWTACTAPKTFAFTSVSGAGDGTYLFQVRATNYVIQDARQFTLLTTKPQTQISSSTAPESSFSLRAALFVLSIADNRDVTWQCQLTNSGTWDGGKVSGMTTVPAAGSTGASAWQPCTSPQEYLSLPAGSFTFQAQATDLAGNVESATATPLNSQSWPAVTLPPSYAIITGGSAGYLYVNKASVSFAAYPASSAATYRCQLEVFNDATSVWSVQSAFATCTSPQAYSSLQAGTYRFSAMLTGQAANQAAQAFFVVDTEGPAVNITSAPASITNGELVSFVFASEGASSYQCRFLNVSAGTSPDFANCTSPARQAGLSDGNWIFQVQALATSGVSGTAVSASFLVDSTPPTINKLILSYTLNKQAVNVTVDQSGGSASVPAKIFQIYTIASDGLLGSGLAPNGSCRLVDLQHPLTSSGVKTCSSPVSYSPGQGTYYFQTVVADQAGNAAAYNATILSSGALSSISQLSWYLAVGLGASVWMLL